MLSRPAREINPEVELDLYRERFTSETAREIASSVQKLYPSLEALQSSAEGLKAAGWPLERVGELVEAQSQLRKTADEAERSAAAREAAAAEEQLQTALAERTGMMISSLFTCRSGRRVCRRPEYNRDTSLRC